MTTIKIMHSDSMFTKPFYYLNDSIIYNANEVSYH